MKCAICGRELKNRRAAHGHMMTGHNAEYRESKFALDNFIVEESGEEKKKAGKRPEGFRHLNKSYATERRAIAAGFDFLDSDGNVYSSEEAAAEGWI